MGSSCGDRNLAEAQGRAGSSTWMALGCFVATFLLGSAESPLEGEGGLVSNWAELTTACNQSRANITLSRDFDSSDYTRAIDFSGKSLVIWGNNAILDAGHQGGFFNGDGHMQGRQTLLVLNSLTLQNSHRPAHAAERRGRAITAIGAADLRVFNCTFFNNTVHSTEGLGLIWLCEEYCMPNSPAPTCSSSQAHQICLNGQVSGIAHLLCCIKSSHFSHSPVQQPRNVLLALMIHRPVPS